MFNPIFNPFSKYADRFEKKIDQLLKRIIFYSQIEIQKKLLDLMQENLVIVNVWLEKEFKGYKYLKKSNRRRMYENTSIILEAFKNFNLNYKIDSNKIITTLQNLNVKLSPENLQKISYIAQIMAFLQPGKYYNYLEGASFGKLLKNLNEEKMIGDCNQIVTFYTFLYSLKFPLADLQIKILPGHVCLHFQGIDIEATNATFQKYEKFDYLLPISELISTNLLDISDFRDKQIQIDKRVLLKGAELAFNISSLRELVEKNLQVAYQNLAIESAKESDFETAKFFLEKIRNTKLANSRINIQELEKNIFTNAVIYYCKQFNFSKARFYADKLMNVDLSEGDKFKKYAQEQEGFYYFKNGQLANALTIFKNIGNQEMVKACYGEEFNQVQKKVAGLRTNVEAKNHKNDYRRMLELAKLMGNQDLAEKINKILNTL